MNSLSTQFNSRKDLEKNLRTKPEEWWIKRGQKMALQLFHAMAARVPAYRSFLKEHGIRAASIKNIDDFRRVPKISKENYLRRNKLSDLCWDANLTQGHWIYSTTSGSTGKKFYFPRQELQSEQYAALAELYLRTNFQIHKKKTLYIIGFPMGSWIGGLFTFQALDIIAKRRKYSISIITPGINKNEIIEAVRELGKNFDQVIIGSYGPFLKDILDDGEKAGLNWKRYNLGFIFSAEGFSENFRDYVIKKAGAQDRIYTATLNHYGTADLGTMSYETPLSILIRRRAINSPFLHSTLFGKTVKLPTLTQYIPELFYFETIDGSLLCSAYSGIPLVKYDLKDNGGVFYYSDVVAAMRKNRVDIYQETKQAVITHSISSLPFVYVYERNDFSVSFFAFNIYPETIRRSLEGENFDKYITGKFTMIVKYNKEGRQKLVINIECKNNHQLGINLKRQIKQNIIKQLITENDEYLETRKVYGRLTDPLVIFWPYETEKFFRPGIKQKWSQKNFI